MLMNFEAELGNASPPITRDSWKYQLRIHLSCEAKVKLQDALDCWRSEGNFDQADGYGLVRDKTMHAACTGHHAGTYLVRLAGIQKGKRSASSLLKRMAQASSFYERARPRAAQFDRLEFPVIPQGTLERLFLQGLPGSTRSSARLAKRLVPPDDRAYFKQLAEEVADMEE